MRSMCRRAPSWSPRASSATPTRRSPIGPQRASWSLATQRRHYGRACVHALRFYLRGAAGARAWLLGNSMAGNAMYVRCPVLSALAGAHGHREAIPSTLEVTFNQSGRIAWKGANANGYQIRSMVGEVDVMVSSTVLYFIWNSGYIEGEAQSAGKVIRNGNRPTFAYVLPPGTRVGFRLKEVGENRQLSVELERDFLLGAAGFEHPVSFDIVETWDYKDPLSWQLARVIYDECISRAPQGTLYTETAATLLAMHLVRNLSTATRLLK